MRSALRQLANQREASTGDKSDSYHFNNEINK